MQSPDGKYVAIAYYTLSEKLRYRSHGQEDSSMGQIRIETNDGESLGEVPNIHLQLINNIRWEGDVACIQFRAFWHFKKRTFEYWDDNQTKLTKMENKAQ